MWIPYFASSDGVVDELEHQVATHDKAIVSLFDAIKKLMAPPDVKPGKIGFIQDR